MITSKMNRTNGSNRTPRIFLAILLVTIGCLVILYYNEHQTAKDAESLSESLEQQTHSLEESTKQFSTLKKACGDDREESNRIIDELRIKEDSYVNQIEDWKRKYESVTNDKNTLEGEVTKMQDELRLVKEAAEHKDIDIKTLKEQISTNAQKCSSDKLSAVGEVTRSEQAKCSTEKNELTVKVDQCERSVKTISEQLRQQQDDMKNQRNDYLVKQQQGEDKRSAFPQHHEEGLPHDSTHDKLTQQLKEKLLQQMMSSQHHHDNVINDHQSDQSAQPNEPRKVDFTQFFNNKLQQQQPQTESHVTSPPTETHVIQNNNDDHMMHVGISHSNSDDDNNSSDGEHLVHPQLPGDTDNTTVGGSDDDNVGEDRKSTL